MQQSTIEQAKSIPELFFLQAGSYPDGLVYRQAYQQDQAVCWQEQRYAQVAARVSKAAAFLQQLGLRPGDRVAIIANTRAEWMEADLAILAAGGVVVAVYPSFTAHEIGYLLYDSGAAIVFVENSEQYEKLRHLMHSEFEIPATEERPASKVALSLKALICFETQDIQLEPNKDFSWQEVVGYSESTLNSDAWQAITPATCATLVYTSGTTGAPKGVIQSHANHLANVRQARQAQMYNHSSRLMLVLPLAHSFAKLMGYIGFLTGAHVCFSRVASRSSSKPDLAVIAADIRVADATILPLVPRMLEKIQAALEHRAEGMDLASRLLRITLGAAVRRFEALSTGKMISMKDQLLYLLTGRIRRSIRSKAFGAALESIISGGAKLNLSTAQFFEALGIEVLEGYGLTETCVATNVNRRGRKRLGSVGPLLADDIELKIEADGEILFRGPNVTSGYYQRPAATAAAWDSAGWFHTGDLGRVDEDGFLYITGRKKELIVTSGGKKIAPEPIELQLKRSLFVSQAMLYGEGRNYCVVLITVSEAALKAWAANTGYALGADLPRDPKVNELLWKEVQRVNASLASFESIKKMLLLADDWSVDNKLLTPTLKVRRKEVEKRFAAEIEALYANSKE